MNFGNFDEKNLFEIENSNLLKTLGEGIKTVEFILLRSNKNIVFLEAKKPVLMKRTCMKHRKRK